MNVKRHMRVVGGISLIVCGIAIFASFKYFLVDPAYTHLPSGGYGELYGPVSFFRIPVYVLCILTIAVGILLISLCAMRR